MTTIYNRQYGLQADSLGFLVSQNRLERATRDMGQDIKKMVNLLQKMRTDREDNPPPHHLSGLALVVAQAKQKQTVDVEDVLARLDFAVRPTVDMDSLIAREPSPFPTRPTVDISTHEDFIRLIRSQVPTAHPTNSPPIPTPTPDVKRAADDLPNSQGSGIQSPVPTADTPPRPAVRGSASPTPPHQVDRAKTAVTGGIKHGVASPRGVDPTIDAFNELGTLFSPVAKAAGFMFKPVGAMWRNRKKKEPLSDEENRHNRRQINMLSAIANALGRNAGRAGRAGDLPRGLPNLVLPAVAAASAFAIEKINEWNEKNDNPIGELTAQVAALLGNEEAKAAVQANKDQPKTLISDSPANQSWDERWLVMRASFGSEEARQELRTRYPKNNAGYYGMPMGSKEAALKKLEGAGAKTNYSKSPKGKLSPDKAAKIKEVAQRIGVDPNDLASIISFETVGTFKPSIKNPTSSATGLIQFMGEGATKKGKFNDGKYYGMSRDQFGALSFDEQMGYVEKYYKERGFDGKTQRSLADAYTAVSGFGYKAGSPAYELNSKWDTNGNKVIEKGEAVLAPEFQAHVKKWIPDDVASSPNPPKSTDKPAPTPVMQSNPNAKAGASGGVLGDAVKAMQATGAMMAVPPLPTVVSQARVASVSAIPPAPQVKMPTRVPPPPAPKPAPERLGSKSSQQQPQVISMGDGISQNVSDRDIAHAVTGGIGMRSWNR